MLLSEYLSLRLHHLSIQRGQSARKIMGSVKFLKHTGILQKFFQRVLARPLIGRLFRSREDRWQVFRFLILLI